jgi:hypothetical protein
MSLDIGLYCDVDLGGPELDRFYVGDPLNATHNLGTMWKALGIYEALYESSGDCAGTYVETLRRALNELETHPQLFRSMEIMDPSTGNVWGTYEWALDFLKAWVDLCATYPKANIWLSR